MATSRKRERELARRRFERRRQQQLERRAKAKRRNTVVGAVVGVVVVLAAIGVGIAAIAGAFSSSKKSSTASVSSSASPSASTSPSASAPPAPKKCAKISPDPPYPGSGTVPNVTGKAPTKLVVKDVKVGHGRTAKKGDALQVLYTGVSCSTGKAFDSSYKAGGTPTPLPVSALGSGQVIPGFDQGLVGIKPGGVRELVIPASLGYGAAGGSGIKGNETLIFLVKATSVKAGSG